MRGKPPFEQVVRDHGHTVFRVCCAIAGADDADDAWSETFLSAMSAYPALPLDANVEAWLVTIAHRRSIDTTRARSRRPTPIPNPTSGPHHDQQPALNRLDDGLVAALSELPDKQRRTIAYHYLAGLPYKDVADIVGGTPAAARRAAADGIRRLRTTTDILPTSPEENP